MNLIELVGQSGLTGRGGGGFPTATKLAAASRHRARLIINACDGELGAGKDEWTVRHHLAEVTAAAEAIAGSDYVIAAHRHSAAGAVLQRAGIGCLWVPGRYVSSEESALVNLANGGPARPLARTGPITSGSRAPDGRALPPTLVINAETAWRIDQIARRGPAWFRSFGTAHEPGPRLITLSGAVTRPGVYETAAGATMNDLISLAGGLSAPADSIWLNGLGGGFVPLPSGYQTRWQRDDLARHGLRIGPAIMNVMNAAYDPWQMIFEAVRYAAGETAGQCGPCMFGLPALVQDLELLVSGNATAIDRHRFDRRVRQLAGRGSCRHPDGVAGFLLSSINTFGWRLPPVRQHPAEVRRVIA